jgi:hypothetical protein
MFLQYHLLMIEAITSTQRLFEGHSEIIWTQIICNNFITIRPNTKLLAQYIHILYTAATGNFRMASQNHSLGLLQYHSWTAAGSVSLPHFKLHTQLNKLLCADAFSSQTASNWPWIPHSVMPSLERMHIVHLFSPPPPFSFLLLLLLELQIHCLKVMAFSAASKHGQILSNYLLS